MRSFFRRKQFKKDFKRCSRNPHFDPCEFERVLSHLAYGESLDDRHRAHPLSGEFEGCFECHIQPDVLLIYHIDERSGVVYLVRIGSHSELF